MARGGAWTRVGLRVGVWLIVISAGAAAPEAAEAPLVETRRGFFCKASYLWRF
jgi:hypothetical protein